jgi:flagellar motor switch protein FliG
MKLANLEAMNDEEIQNWLRKVDPTALGIALLDVSEGIKNCIFRNMSERAVAAFNENIERYKSMDAKELIILMNTKLVENTI